MELYTTRVNRRIMCQTKGITFLDTTIKTGDKRFAPTWDMVTAFKEGRLRPDDYRREYYDLMRKSYVAHKERWLEVVSHTSPVAIACFCQTGLFCHRHLLKTMFEKVCLAHAIPFVYKGELI